MRLVWPSKDGGGAGGGAGEVGWLRGLRGFREREVKVECLPDGRFVRSWTLQWKRCNVTLRWKCCGIRT